MQSGCISSGEVTINDCFVTFVFRDLISESLITTTKSTRAKHPYKLYVKPARLNCYKNSFFIRIFKRWNSLPRDIVEAESLQLFKSKLKSHMNI